VGGFFADLIAVGDPGAEAESAETRSPDDPRWRYCMGSFLCQDMRRMRRGGDSPLLVGLVLIVGERHAVCRKYPHVVDEDRSIRIGGCMMTMKTLNSVRSFRLIRATFALISVGMVMSSGCFLRNDLGQAVRAATVNEVESGFNALLQDDQEAAGAAFGSALVDGLVELITPESSTAQ
jgi:hypothetical protein